MNFQFPLAPDASVVKVVLKFHPPVAAVFSAFAARQSAAPARRRPF